MIKIILFIILFISQLVFSQNEKNINGKIIVKDATPQGVHIINLNNEKEVVSNEKGEFTIAVKPDDLLVFSSNHLDYFRKVIEEKDFGATVVVSMTSKINQLEEVEVTQYSNINAVDLGIIAKPAKQYTPAERRLKTAGDFKPIHLLNIIGGGMPVDPIINAITGRTALLKKELRVERHEIALAKVVDLYNEDYYVKKLKIKKDYIKGFQYYIVEDEDFLKVLKSKNKTMIALKVSELAVVYNTIIKKYED